MYPASRQLDEDGDCIDYDPRFRPWYVAATSGAKNVILLIDVSGSMSGTRIQSAKEAAVSVVNTLSNSDFVGVVSFASKAETLHSTKVLRATNKTKDKIIDEIEDLQANGKTNYEAALRKGLRMLELAEDDEYGAPCKNGENIVLFLTDGEPTEGVETAEGLKDVIEEYTVDITLFTYGFGSNVDHSILIDLSCEYSGIHFRISGSSTQSELATIMRAYYTYVAEGLEI